MRTAANAATLSVARHLLEEQMDEVKEMNAKVQYVKTMAIRDKQVKVSEGSAGGGSSGAWSNTSRSNAPAVAALVAGA